MIETDRLRLIPSTIELARAEIGDPARFAELLAAEIPSNWPPESLADALAFFLALIESNPDKLGWFAWYAVRRESATESATLIASAGFTGPPTDGIVETGYSVLPQFQKQGYATEIVNALTNWAFEHPGILSVAAETHRDNMPSLRLLSRLGFVPIGDGVEPNCARFELRRGAWASERHA